MNFPKKEIKVLVVDDNGPLREIICYELGKRGFTTEAAEDGKEAIERIAQNKPDIIILDIAMPLMDGLQVCERLKKNKDTQHIPIILLSAQEPVASFLQDMTGAPIKYIKKPCALEYLLAQVNDLLL